MNERDFDSFIHPLSASLTRRCSLSALGGALAVVLGRLAIGDTKVVDAAERKRGCPKGRRCGKKQCCKRGQVCLDGRCVSGRGTCEAGQNSCAGQGVIGCNGGDCVCFVTTRGATFCGVGGPCTRLRQGRGLRGGERAGVGLRPVQVPWQRQRLRGTLSRRLKSRWTDRTARPPAAAGGQT